MLKTLDGIPPGPYTNHINEWSLQNFWFGFAKL
jgi:hypothetical protein